MKVLLISDVDIINGIVTTACIIAFIYLIDRLYRYRSQREGPSAISNDKALPADETPTRTTATALAAGALIVGAHQYIQRIVGNLYTAIKAKHHLGDRSIYISSSLL